MSQQIEDMEQRVNFFVNNLAEVELMITALGRWDASKEDADHKRRLMSRLESAQRRAAYGRHQAESVDGIARRLETERGWRMKGSHNTVTPVIDNLDT